MPNCIKKVNKSVQSLEQVADEERWYQLEAHQAEMVAEARAEAWSEWDDEGDELPAALRGEW